MTAAAKRCNKCRETLTLDWFYRNRRRPDGHRAECKPCVNAANGNPGYTRPDLVDESAVQRAVAGDRVPLNRAERRLVVAALVRREVSLRGIARLTGIPYTTAHADAATARQRAAS